jgi:molecular chaperone GrpE
MTKDNRDNIEEQDILEEAEQEIEEIENNEGEIDEEKLDEAMNPDEEKTKEVLARTMADFENFKKRTLRDRDDMVFFIKQDILKKILPRIDDIQRILKDTPDEFKQ